MELWYTENHSKDVQFSMKVDRQLYSGKSHFQRIDVLDTPEFGRVLTLDGFIMVTEKDEFIYHDMIVHVPMAVNPDIRRVLLIGAGDGGAVRELVRYAGIEQIDMVEIDQMVVDVCKSYLPKVASGFGDPRLHLHFEDGLRYVRFQENQYDLIIVDSTDPFGPGEGLFTREFYGNCFKALKEDGIMVNQHESPFYDEDEEPCRAMHRKAYRSFPISRVYQAHIPTCAAGYWLFGFASKKYHPIYDLDAARWNRRGIKTWYYTTNLHTGAFMLPKYVEDLLIEEEKKI